MHGGHLPLDHSLRRCQNAAFRLLYEIGGFERGLSTPHVEADLYGEVNPGGIHVDVTVTSIGRTSFSLRCEVYQNETRVAVTTLVLVSFDYARKAAVLLSPAQRFALQSHVVG